jgi:hypothetical protein
LIHTHLKKNTKNKNMNINMKKMATFYLNFTNQDYRLKF